MFELFSRSKILCTMGPAIAGEDKIINLVQAGASAFRLNMSHGSQTTHASYIQTIRNAEKKLGVYLPILADLQGPKIRVADLPGGPISLVSGREIIIADITYLKMKRIKIPDNLVPVEYPTIAIDVKPGDALLFDDGLLKVQVIESDGLAVRAMVINGGLLKPRKGLNLPDSKISQPSITTKDKNDALFAIEHNTDYIALSFVRKPDDIRALRKFLTQNGSKQWIVAKIEKPEAITNIEKIIEVSDAIMVARGDLGVEISAALVPILQKKIISLCNAYGKPVITATQMLESMIQNPRPTRAEASDVANAVLDGTDAVMLSAETSVGAYPIEAVSYMRTICAEAEQNILTDGVYGRHKVKGLLKKVLNTDSIARCAADIAEEARVSAIVSLSYSGETALLISNKRPRAPIIAVTELVATARRVGLFWGTMGFVVKHFDKTDEAIDMIKTDLVAKGLLAPGSTVIITIGRPLVAKSRTNMLSLEVL